MHFSRAAAVALAALVLSTAPASAQSIPMPSNDPLKVVDAFELARGASDVDAALSQIADDGVITVQGDMTRSYAGAIQLRTYLQTTGTRFQTVMRSRPMVQGNSVAWAERDQYGNQVVDATVIAIVDGGRITSLTYRDTNPSTVPGRSSPVTTVQAKQLPNAAWAALLAVVGSGLLAGASLRPFRKAPRSQLTGRLVSGLRRAKKPA
jgi:hypothetical protein